MNFWEFTACMYCVLSSGDLGRFVVTNQATELPPNNIARSAFFILSFPATIGVFALPIYGIFVMPWWQPFLGMIVATIAVTLLTRSFFRQGHLLYLWTIAFSLAAVGLFVYFQLK